MSEEFLASIVDKGLLEPVHDIPYWAFKTEREPSTRKRQYTWKRTKWLGRYLLEGKESKSGDRTVTLSEYGMKSGKLKAVLSASGLDKFQSEQTFAEIEELYKNINGGLV